MTDITIMPAKKEDCNFIAEGIIEAVGPDLCEEGLGRHILPGAGTVKDLFSRVAEKEYSQYSYRNALIARDAAGNPVGVAVAYDGAELHSLRQAFVDVFNEMCGSKLSESEFDDETSPDEIYLDTLAVSPQHRRQGLGKKLILEVEKRFRGSGKPLGLLAAKDNHNARHLYEKLGFKIVGPRKFCGVEMHHMQKPQ